MVFLNRANLHSHSSIILSMAIVVRSTFNSIALADGRLGLGLGLGLFLF